MVSNSSIRYSKPGGAGGAGGAGATDTGTEASPSKFREAVDNILAAGDVAQAPGT